MNVRAVALPYPWSEAEISWNAANSSSITLGSVQGPSDPAALSAESVAVSGGDHWWRWDVTGLVQAWTSGERANEGLMLVSEDVGRRGSAAIVAREGEHPAVLDVRLAAP